MNVKEEHIIVFQVFVLFILYSILYSIIEAEKCFNVEPELGKFHCMEIHPKSVCTGNTTCPENYECFEFDVKPFSACVDIDECERDMHNCSGTQQCFNIPGGYECVGLVDPADVCLEVPCDDGFVCQKVDGTYSCVPDPSIEVILYKTHFLFLLIFG